MHIQINFPNGRLKLGTLKLYGTPDIGPLLLCDCLGRAVKSKATAKGNPDRDPVKPWGHIPLGEYPKVPVFYPKRRMSIGEAGIPLLLDGAVGEEVEQARRNRRYGLYIHAGRGSPRLLIPTFGCARIRFSEFIELLHLIGDREIAVRIA